MKSWLTLLVGTTACISLCVTTHPLAAQTPKPAPAAAQQGPTAFVRGVVVDTLGTPLTQASVVVMVPKTKTDSETIVASATTDSKGRFTLPRVPAKGHYVIVARKVGYGVASSKAMSFAAKDTTEIRFELALNELTTVYVSAPLPKEYRIDSTEINKHAVHDALDVVMNYRPRMLGDVYKQCPPDTSHLTIDHRLYRRLPRFMGDPSHYPPFRLFINGVWHGEQGVKDILAQIPAEDILEMRYVSCWDRVTPELQNSLIVVLKPGASY